MGTPLFEHDDFDWSDEITIEQFIAKKLDLPQLIIITNGFYDSSFERTIDNYQIICISGFSTQERINGIDSQKCEISLPMNCDILKFTKNPNCSWEQKFLFEILRNKKLPCKVFLSECSRDVFLHTYVERVEDKLSELLLTHKSQAFFLYGFTMDETKLHALDIITLPSYLFLTFKVAICFKEQRKSLKNLLKYMDNKIKRTMPGYKAHKDIVFSRQLGVGCLSSTTPVIVSLNEAIQKKDNVKTRRPLPPLPDQGGLIIDSGLYEILEPISVDEDKSKCLSSSANRYTKLPLTKPRTASLKNSSETLSSTKTSDESSSKKKIESDLQKELASRFNKSVNLQPVHKKRLNSLPEILPIPQQEKVSRRHSFINDNQSYMEMNKITVENEGNSKCKWDVCHLSIGEVAETLKLLGLEKFIPQFQKEKVDGIILNSLTKEILTNEFNMRRIESLRLLHFIQSGHVPM